MNHRTLVLVAASALAGAALVAASAGAGTATPGRQAAQARTITFCSDTTYPPMEYLKSGKPTGADIDIAYAAGKLIGASVKIKVTGFDVIIPALLKKKCDAIISSMTDSAERRKQVDFADYITVGMVLMVKRGNPQKITGLASLSGKSVAVQAATLEKAALDTQNKLFAKQGKKKITVKIFPADTSAAAALITGKVDAYFADATPVYYYIKTTGGKFQAAGPQIATAPEGIATRKGDPLGKEMRTAIAKMYANGTMKQILAKWGVSAFALKK